MKWKNLWAGLSIIIGSCLLTLVGICLYSYYLDYQLARLPFNPEIVHPYVNNDRDKGMAMFRLAAQQKDIFLLGSSELEIHVPQHPNYMFPNKQAPWNVYPSGRAYAQSLQEAIRLGSLPKEELKGQKIVLITSMQWFSLPEIITAGQLARFSELQFYKLLQNPSLTETEKQYIAARMKKFMEANESFTRPWLYAKLYLSKDPKDKLYFTLLQPYYKGMEAFLTLRDKRNTYKYVQKMAQGYQAKEPPLINWGAEYAKAEQQGKLSCTNNNMYIEDSYYKRWIAPNLQVSKGASSKIDLLNSKEWEDLDMFLQICRDNGVELYVVFMSTNGRYYDWCGIDKKMRDAFYDKLAAQMKKYQVPYLDLRAKEYSPYFYYDAMHLGWKGWLYVDEQLTKHYSTLKQ